MSFHRYIKTLVEDTKNLAIAEESLGTYKDGVFTFDWFTHYCACTDFAFFQRYSHSRRSFFLVVSEACQ